MEIRFSSHIMEQSPDCIDIMNFVNQVSAHEDFKLKDAVNLDVNHYKSSPHPDSKKMVIVTIQFQTWKAGEGGKGTTWLWTNNRAKDHSCSNRDFEKIESKVLI